MNYSTKLAYVSLEELLNAPLLNGKHEKGMCFGPGTRIVRMVNLYRGDTVNVNSLDRVEYPHLPANDYFLNEGDLLVNRTSLKREGVGKAALVPNLPEPVYFDCSIIRIRPNKSKVYPRYLLYALNGPVVRPQIMKGAKTATITTISQPDISSLRIPLPPLPEQRRIAAILDKADSIRRKRQEAIRLTDEFLRSAFLDMFGDPVTNPKGWNTGTIESIVDNSKSGIRCGPFGTQLKVHELVSSGIPLLGIENVHIDRFIPNTTRYLTPKKAKQLSHFDTRAGDVLITRMGTIGRACVVPEDIGKARISYHLFRVRPNPKRCLPEFLSASISRSGMFQAQLHLLAHGAIMDGLSTGNLREILFLLPPVPKQKEYVQIVKRVERTKQKNNKTLDESEQLFNSLVQRAFRGEL